MQVVTLLKKYVKWNDYMSNETVIQMVARLVSNGEPYTIHEAD